jgi:hypothetical protein
VSQEQLTAYAEWMRTFGSVWSYYFSS